MKHKLYLFSTLFVLTMSLSSCQMAPVRYVTDFLLNKNTEKQNSLAKSASQAFPTKDTESKEIILSTALEKYCEKIQSSFDEYRWGESRCKEFEWNHVRDSVLGTPLIWKVYGSEEEHKQNKKNTTLVLCTVHGDEITPAKFCFDILHELNDGAKLSSDNLVVIAPIVNPDSFFKSRPTRTNYRGVDINRNFPTNDWRDDALRLWKHRYRSDKRRYPGPRPLSEPEVLFQVNLIKRYRPDKIISVHAPLTMLDYDGPDHNHHRKTSKNGRKEKGLLANQLLVQMSKSASGYRIKKYPYFPGSLGNYAGNERNIPTYTLELPSSDPSKSDEYWSLFRQAILHALNRDFRPDKDEDKNPQIAARKTVSSSSKNAN